MKDAGKPGHQHKRRRALFSQKGKTIPTNHERVVAGRARRMGISVATYRARFS